MDEKQTMAQMRRCRPGAMCLRMRYFLTGLEIPADNPVTDELHDCRSLVMEWSTYRRRFMAEKAQALSLEVSTSANAQQASEDGCRQVKWGGQRLHFVYILAGTA